MAAAIRPQYHDELESQTRNAGLAFAIQPVPKSDLYLRFREWVADLDPDLIWVNCYSMIVRPDVLGITALGGINIHGGLLPQYRGCNPTQWAILNGERVTGVTMHEMTARIDDGPIIDQIAVPLYHEDTWVTAHRRIAAATDELIARNLPAMLRGRWEARPQDPEGAAYYRRRTPDDGYFEWSWPVVRIYDLVRALVAPHPGAFYYDRGGRKVVLDSFMSLAQLVELKFGPVGESRIHCGDKELVPVRSQADISEVFRFTILDTATRTEVGFCRFEILSWGAGTIELVVRSAGDCPTVINSIRERIVEFCATELQLNCASATGSTVADQ